MVESRGTYVNTWVGRRLYQRELVSKDDSRCTRGVKKSLRGKTVATAGGPLEGEPQPKPRRDFILPARRLQEKIEIGAESAAGQLLISRSKRRL